MIRPGAADSEMDLVRAAQEGQAEALDALMRRHRTQVVRYAMRVCISRDDAEDAAQESLVAMTRSLQAFRGAATLLTWLNTVARNHCMRLARRRIRSFLAADGAEAADRAPSPEDEFVDAQLRHKLAEVIGGVDPLYREVLLRRDVLGHPAAEVASELGLTVEAVKSRLHRARGEVKERLLASIEGRGGSR